MSQYLIFEIQTDRHKKYLFLCHCRKKSEKHASVVFLLPLLIDDAVHNFALICICRSLYTLTCNMSPLNNSIHSTSHMFATHKMSVHPSMDPHTLFDFRFFHILILIRSQFPLYVHTLSFHPFPNFFSYHKIVRTQGRCSTMTFSSRAYNSFFIIVLQHTLYKVQTYICTHY